MLPDERIARSQAPRRTRRSQPCPAGRREGGVEGSSLDQTRAGRVDEQGVGLHQGEVPGGHDPSGLGRELQVQAHDVGARAQSASRSAPASQPSARARSSDPARPQASTLHPERSRRTARRARRSPVADDPERLPVQLPPDRRLPGTRPQRDGVLDEAAGRREDQRQRQLRGSIRRPGARADDDAAPRAGLDVDVRRPAARLADQPEVGEQVEQRRVDRRALADQHESLGVADLGGPLGEVRRPLRRARRRRARRRARSTRAARPPAGSPPSRRRAPRDLIAPGREPARETRNPAWVLRFRLTLSRPAVSSFTPRWECGTQRKEDACPSPRKSSRN